MQASPNAFTNSPPAAALVLRLTSYRTTLSLAPSSRPPCGVNRRLWCACMLTHYPTQHTHTHIHHIHTRTYTYHPLHPTLASYTIYTHANTSTNPLSTPPSHSSPPGQRPSFQHTWQPPPRCTRRRWTRSLPAAPSPGSSPRCCASCRGRVRGATVSFRWKLSRFCLAC